MRSVFVRGEGLGDASLTRTALVTLSITRTSALGGCRSSFPLNPSFVVLQCTVAGRHGPSGESVWGPAVFRASSGRSVAQTIQPSMETGERVEGFTGKPVGT